MHIGEHNTIDYVFYAHLGRILHTARQRVGLSLKDVANRLKTTKTTIDNWELGKTRISCDKFNKLCDIYNISNQLEIDIKTKDENYTKITL